MESLSFREEQLGIQTPERREGFPPDGCFRDICPVSVRTPGETPEAFNPSEPCVVPDRSTGAISRAGAWQMGSSVLTAPGGQFAAPDLFRPKGRAAAEKGILHGRVGDTALHLCVDMQRVFGPGYPWAMAWMECVLPRIEDICGYHPARTVFTRFIPVDRPEQACGTWRRYYDRWAEVTAERLGPDPLRLVAGLERFVPPAEVIDKWVYSPWTEGALHRRLAGSGIDTLVITGGETDVCVLATVLGAIDRGYRTILVGDAICSSSDATHDALMQLYLGRFSEQLEVADTAEILASWT